MATVAEVHAAVDPVLVAVNSALLEAQGGFLGFGGDASAANNIRQQKARVEELLAKGLEAVRLGKSPGVTGWAGWRQALQVIADGAAEQAKLSHWLVPAVTETVAAVPKHLKEDVEAGAAVAGDIASGAAAGFLSRAWWVVGIVALGAVGWLYFQSRVVRGK